MTATTLQKTLYLRATPQEVWTFLTEPDALADWFHRPNTALRQGNAYEMCSDGGITISGRVIAAQPCTRLQYTFHVPPMGDTISTVTWELEPVPGGTRLCLTHDGLPQAVAHFGLTLALDQGWDAHFAKLRRALASEVEN